MTSSQRMTCSCSRRNQKHIFSSLWRDLMSDWNIFSVNWCDYQNFFVRSTMSARMNQRYCENDSRHNGENLRRFVLMIVWLDRRKIDCIFETISESTIWHKRIRCLSCNRNARLNQRNFWILDRNFFVRSRKSILNRKWTNDKSWFNVDDRVLRNTNKHQKMSFRILWFSCFKIHSIERQSQRNRWFNQKYAKFCKRMSLKCCFKGARSNFVAV